MRKKNAVNCHHDTRCKKKKQNKNIIIIIIIVAFMRAKPTYVLPLNILFFACHIAICYDRTIAIAVTKLKKNYALLPAQLQ